MRWRLRYQLLVPILTLLLGVVAGGTLAAVSSARRAAERQIEEQMRSIARSLGEGNFPLTPNVLQQVKSLSGAEYLVVPPEGSGLSTLPAATTALDLGAEVADSPQDIRLGPARLVGHEAFLVTGVRLRSPLDQPPATLYILYPESRWRDAVWQAMRPSFWLGGLGAAVAVTLAVWIAHRLSCRVQDIQRQTKRIACGDFTALPLPTWNDELRDLVQSINDMAQQLARLQETVRLTERLRLLGQVSGGLVHQLRNGVAGARLAVQLHAGECVNGTDREALDVALRQLQLVEERLQRFLQMGRTNSTEHRVCSVAELAQEAFELLRPQCRHQQIEFLWQPPAEACMIQGDPNQLGHLFVNVMTNAVEAAGPGGIVEVRLMQDGADALVEVRDSGGGPPADMADRLFDPFVTNKPGGVGIGLAVARQVAEAHAGSIAWRRVDDRTSFVIRLPLIRQGRKPPVAPVGGPDH
jgi:signal transduction histidine kinase